MVVVIMVLVGIVVSCGNDMNVHVMATDDIHHGSYGKLYLSTRYRLFK